jgi:hypothetical protein
VVAAIHIRHTKPKAQHKDQHSNGIKHRHTSAGNVRPAPSSQRQA